MPNYKSPDNKLHFLDDTAFEYLLPQGSVQITDEEAETIANPPPTVEQKIDALKAEIDAIEREEIMPRKTREIQIQVMLYFAQQQGLTSEQLYAANPAYQGMVDIDNEIKTLRAQL